MEKIYVMGTPLEAMSTWRIRREYVAAQKNLANIVAHVEGIISEADINSRDKWENELRCRGVDPETVTY